MAKPNRKTKAKRDRSSRPSAVAATARRIGPLLPFALPALLAVAAFVAFAPALGNGFLGWDDDENIVSNPYYRGLGAPQLRWMFTALHMGHYQPLSWITFALDYLFWGMNPAGYHLTNVVLHAANAVVFYLLAARLLSLAGIASARSNTLRLASAVAALFFALHPLRVESVAWITQRRDVLAGFFFLATLLFYVRAATGETPRAQRLWLGAALATYLLSLLSKAVGITLPLVLVVMDLYPLRRLNPAQHGWFGGANRRVWLEKTPFAVLAVAGAIFAWMAQRESGAMKSLDSYGLSLRLFQVFYGLAFYLWKTLLPVNLSPLYQVPKFLDPTAPAFLLSIAAVSILTFILIRFRQRWPAGLAAWICYAMILSPVLGIAQSGEQFVADRYSYLASLPWALLIGAAPVYLWRRWPASKIGHRRIAGVTVLCLLGLAILSWQQTKIWRDSETLWRAALEIDPSSSVIHNNLASALLEGGKTKEALELYQEALKIDPQYADAHFNLGMAYTDMEQLDLAAEQFLTGLKYNPKSAKARYYFALLYVRRGDLPRAIEQFRESLKIAPSQSSVRIDLGTALALQGRLGEAVAELRRAIALYPGSASAHHKLGRVLAAQNLITDATREFREALRINPDYAAAHMSLSEALAEQGMHEEAAKHQREAARLQEKVRQSTRPGA